MNSAIAHIDVTRWLNATLDERFLPQDIDSAINEAVAEVIKDRMDSRLGGEIAGSLVLRSELMPLTRTCSAKPRAMERVSYDKTLALAAGYGYQVKNDLTDPISYAKLFNAGFPSRKDSNGNPVVINGVPQVSNEVVRIPMKTYVSVEGLEIYKTVSPLCQLNGMRVERTSLEEQFLYLVNLRIQLNNVWYDTIPVKHEELPVVQANPNTRPSISNPMPLCYNVEDGDGFTIEAGVGHVDDVELTYIRLPDPIFSGKEYDLSTVPKEQLVNKRVIVRSNEAVISNSVYRVGDELVIYGDHTLQEGIVAEGYRNNQLPQILYGEVCKRAAMLLCVSENNELKIGALAGASK